MKKKDSNFSCIGLVHPSEYDWEEQFFLEDNFVKQDKRVAVDDPLFISAVETILKIKRVSTSYLQTIFSIGYNRAYRLIWTMEKLEIISPKDKAGKRKILITEEEWENKKKNLSSF